MQNEDTTIKIGSEVGLKVNCDRCEKPGTTESFVTLRDNKNKDIHLCGDCREKTNAEFSAETKDANIPLAILFGVVGAAIGGILWYLITTITKTEVAYLAIGLGYIIGFAVHLGSGKKRGMNLQVISAVLTVIALFVSEKFIFSYFANSYIQTHLSEFPGIEQGQMISIPVYDSAFLHSLVSPIGLLIYAIGIYFAFKYCKPRKI